MVIVTADSNQYFSVFSGIRGYNVYQIIWTPRGRKVVWTPDPTREEGSGEKPCPEVS